MFIGDWLIVLLIGIIIFNFIKGYPSYEGFNCNACQPHNPINMCHQDPIGNLYKNWGSGGIQTSEPEKTIYSDGGLLRTYNIPPYYSPASLRDPHNTLIDQEICTDYAERSCLNVMGHDRYDYCRSAQYDSCLEGRKRLIWQASD